MLESVRRLLQLGASGHVAVVLPGHNQVSLIKMGGILSGIWMDDHFGPWIRPYLRIFHWPQWAMGIYEGIIREGLNNPSHGNVPLGGKLSPDSISLITQKGDFI